MSAKLLFLSGSIRKESFNTKLIREAVALAREAGADVTLVDLKDFPMPIYNGDLEAESGLPEAAKQLKKLFREHTGFMIASPEYNSSISPLLKNALDWISRKETPDEPALVAFQGKVAGLVAASTGGFGGLRGLVPLRLMFSNIGVFVIPSQLAIPFADKAFDTQGKFTDPKQREALQGVVNQFCETADRFAI